jgi:hypothetical protein
MMKERSELYDEEQHRKRQAFEQDQEAKRLQFQTEQERKRLEFQAKLEKARQDWWTIVIAFVAVVVSIVAAVFAGLQWKSSKDALQITQRPWLGVEFVGGSDPWRFDLKNVGLSVAQDVTYQFSCEAGAGDTPTRDTNHEPFKSRPVVLLPGQSLSLGCRKSRQEYFGDKDSVRVTFRAHYEDVFRVRHKADYCVCFEKSHPDHNIPCTEGNFAD